MAFAFIFMVCVFAVIVVSVSKGKSAQVKVEKLEFPDDERPRRGIRPHTDDASQSRATGSGHGGEARSESSREAGRKGSGCRSRENGSAGRCRKRFGTSRRSSREAAARGRPRQR